MLLEALSISSKQSAGVFFIPQGAQRDTIQPSATALDHDSQLPWSYPFLKALRVCCRPLWGGGPFVKLSVGRDKMHFLYYQIDQEGDGQPLCLWGEKKGKGKALLFEFFDL